MNNYPPTPSQPKRLPTILHCNPELLNTRDKTIVAAASTLNAVFDPNRLETQIVAPPKMLVQEIGIQGFWMPRIATCTTVPISATRSMNTSKCGGGPGDKSTLGESRISGV